METVASKVSFYQFATLLDKISALNKEDKKKRLLKAFVNEWRQFEARILANGKLAENDSFFPAMRLLLPQLDKDREAYGIKEHSLVRLFIEIFGLGKNSPSAQTLVNYKSPKTSNKFDVTSIDFAATATSVLKDRCPEKGSLTLEDVNIELDQIAVANASKDREKVQRSLLHLMKNVSGREIKWLIRMILKEVRLGVGQRSVFHSYHGDAEELYNVKMSLEKVCTTLKDPSIRLHEIEVSLFSPFRPMLAQRESPDSIETLMKKKPYFIEVKFDGERMQLHTENGKFKYFSRGGNEYTHIYGEDHRQGNLTPHLVGAFDRTTRSVVLDGEMVGFDPVTGAIGSKGENFDIKSAHLQKYQPMYVAFDILLRDGKVLANVPVRERRKELEEVVKEIDGRIVVSVVSEKFTNQDCIDALNEAIDKRQEGLMVKDPESVYKPNCRARGGWFKMKPEYIRGLTDDLDLLVVGGFFGAGNSGMPTHFLCAVAVDAGDGGMDPREFHTFCKVGTGYSLAELTELNAKLASDWQPFKRSNPPDWLKFPSNFKQRPDVVVKQPSSSFVFQVKAAEIIESDQYKTGITLRFPRVEKIRYDKPWYDCMTLGQLRDLRKKSDGKLAGRHATSTDFIAAATKKRKIALRPKPTVDKRFCGIDAEKVQKASALFDGKEICVVTGDARNTKSQLEEMIVENGGSIVQNPGDDTFCTIAGKTSLRVTNIIKIGLRDVAKVDWLLRCIQQQQLLSWSPPDLVHASPRTKSKFADNYDLYGDGFYDDTDEVSLKVVFEGMESSAASQSPMTKNDITALEDKYFFHESPYRVFRSCRAVFLPFHVTPSLNAVLFRFHGGILLQTGEDCATHVVIPNDTSYEKYIEETITNRKSINDDQKPRVVYEQWISDSIDFGELQDEKDYCPNCELLQ